jgi:hypothetical protein
MTPVASCAGDVVAELFVFTLTAAVLALNDIIELGVLPANHTVVDATLVPDDLDTNGTPLMSLDVGLMSGDVGDKVSARTCGAELFSGSTAARTGVVERMSAKTGFTIAATGVDRSIGVKIAAAAATQAAAGTQLRLLVSYRAAT